MKTLKYLLITIIMLTAFVSCGYANLNDKSDRLSSDQSNVFSPGYINATMQRTNEIIRQASEQPNNSTENIEANVNNGLSSEVKKNAEEKSALAIKGPKGGGSGENTAKSGTTTSTVATNTIPVRESSPVNTIPVDNTKEINVPQLSADAQDAINKYANDVNGNAVTLTYGDTVVLWSQWDLNKSGNAFYNTYYTLFDSNGNPMAENVRVSNGLGELVGIFAGNTDDVRLLVSGYADEFGGHDVTLSNGDTIVSWTQWDQDSLGGAYNDYFSVLDSNNNLLVYSQLMTNGLGDFFESSAVSNIEDIQKLSSEFAADLNVQSLSLTNGNTVLLWNHGDENFSTYFSLIGSDGGIITNGQLAYEGQGTSGGDNYALDVGSGYFAVVSRQSGGLSCGFSSTSMEYSTMKVYNPAGTTVLAENDDWTRNRSGFGIYQSPITITESGKYITNVEVTALGRITVSYNNGDITNNDIPGVYVPTSLRVSDNLSINTPFSSSDWRNISLLGGYEIYDTTLLHAYNAASSGAINTDTVSGIVKDLVSRKADLITGPGVSAQGISDVTFIRMLQDIVTTNTLNASTTYADNRDLIEMTLVLANILKNPTDAQKKAIDAAEAILNEKASKDNSDLKKAQDDLLQVVANILIAQALPDLLKEGDISNIKGIFDDLNVEKSKIIFEYNESIKPYYTEVKKILSKNLALLQLNNIVSKTMVEEELDKLGPNDIDKLLEKLRKLSNKSFEEDYILQEEAKLHSKYIDPNKKIFEDKLKSVLESFTARLSKILEASKK